MMTVSVRTAIDALPKRSFLKWLMKAKTTGDVPDHILEDCDYEEPPHLRGLLSVVDPMEKSDAANLWRRWRAWQRRHPEDAMTTKKKTKQA